MAANDVVVVKLPIDVGQPYQTTPLGVTFTAAPSLIYPHQGFRMPHNTTTSIYGIFRIPNGATLTTGLTTEILACCDPNTFNADLGGTNAYFDVVFGIHTDGTSLGDDSEFTGGTLAAQTGTLTMPTAVGKLKKLTIAGTNANYTNAAGIIAVGAWCTMRVRRLGTNALDTNSGTVVIAGIDVYAY